MSTTSALLAESTRGERQIGVEHTFRITYFQLPGSPIPFQLPAIQNLRFEPRVPGFAVPTHRVAPPKPAPYARLHDRSARGALTSYNSFMAVMSRLRRGLNERLGRGRSVSAGPQASDRGR